MVQTVEKTVAHRAHRSEPPDQRLLRKSTTGSLQTIARHELWKEKRGIEV